MLIVISCTLIDCGFSPVISIKRHNDKNRLSSIIKTMRNNTSNLCIHDYTFTFVQVDKVFLGKSRICPNIETPLGIGAWLASKSIKKTNEDPKCLILSQKKSESISNISTKSKPDNENTTQINWRYINDYKMAFLAQHSISNITNIDKTIDLYSICIISKAIVEWIQTISKKRDKRKFNIRRKSINKCLNNTDRFSLDIINNYANTIDDCSNKILDDITQYRVSMKKYKSIKKNV